MPYLNFGQTEGHQSSADPDRRSITGFLQNKSLADCGFHTKLAVMYSLDVNISIGFLNTIDISARINRTYQTQKRQS